MKTKIKTTSSQKIIIKIVKKFQGRLWPTEKHMVGKTLEGIVTELLFETLLLMQIQVIRLSLSKKKKVIRLSITINAATWKLAFEGFVRLSIDQ